MDLEFEPNTRGAAHLFLTVSGTSAERIENRLGAGTPGDWLCINLPLSSPLPHPLSSFALPLSLSPLTS